MARPRTELHQILVDLLGSRQVYFKAPENKKMQYPAIVYNRSNYKNTYADNGLYSSVKAYTITFIHRDPDSDLPDKLLQLPFCRFDRHYVSDNLDHDVFIIYF